MGSATAAVAVVIDGHTPSGSEGNILCWCDQRFNFWAEHAKHVAAAVIEALTLTEEWNVTTDMGVHSHKPLTEERAKGLADLYHDMTARRRLVGPWVAVGLEGETP
jgi:hypothetical protein